MEYNRRLRRGSLTALAVAFVAATSFLTITNRREGPLRLARFDWPDEMATAFFVERIVDGQSIASPDPLIAEAANRLHPRSVNVRDSALVPGGFLGFPILLGVIGIWFGFAATFLATPLVAVVGVFSLVIIVRRVFDEQIAWLTGILAFSSPALLYYTSYVMLPNVAFVSLALFGAALIIAKRQFWGGFALGLSLFVRPNELFWILPVFFIFLPLAKQGGGLRWGTPILGLLLGFAPTFLANAAVFGHPLSTGYNRFVDASSNAVSPLEFSGNFFLPFGFHPALIAANLWRSAIKLFWWLSVPTVAGLILWWRNRRAAHGSQLFYVIATIAVSAWLVIYYGSWPFTDVEILNLNTIGRSYVRYWLPIFLLMLPFVAIFLRWIWSHPPLHLPPAVQGGEKRGVGRLLSIALLVVMTFFSVRLVYWSAPESIIPVARRLSLYHGVRRMVEAATPRDAVIVTYRTDKIIFPERRVAEIDLSQGRDREIYDIVSALPAPWYWLAHRNDVEKEQFPGTTRLIAPLDYRYDFFLYSITPNP